PLPPDAGGGDGTRAMAERGDAQQATEALMRSLFCAALLCCAAVSPACAPYSDHRLAAHEAAARADWTAAEDEINAILGVGSRADLPETWSSEESLAVLERAAVLQAQGAWQESARDLSAAEGELELIDFSVDTVGTIATYVYSDSAGKYRTPPLERIALNVFNMANYLAVPDLQGAAVAGRAALPGHARLPREHGHRSPSGHDRRLPRGLHLRASGRGRPRAALLPGCS